jgi:muconate cycloisomerase
MSKIRRVRLDEVLVRAKPDAINSADIDQPLHKLPQGAKRGWTQQFDELSKTILRVELDNGVTGLGETYRAVPELLLRQISAALIGLELDGLNFQNLPLPVGRAYDGFECAILDAAAKTAEVPLCQFLGGRYRDRVLCAYWTGHRTPSDAVKKAEAALAAGYSHIKFKCDRHDPVVDWCAGIASACGDRIAVILDPNERFELASHTEKIARRLADIGNVLYLEDPIPRWDMQSWHHLRSKIAVPISMHISLPYLEMGQTIQDLAAAARVGASDYYNFNGSIYGFRRMALFADLFGVPCSHGSEIDLGILEASYVHKVASIPNGTLPSDIFGRMIREHDLLTTPLTFESGHALVPAAHGLGVALSESALEHYRLAHWEVEA